MEIRIWLTQLAVQGSSIENVFMESPFLNKICNKLSVQIRGQRSSYG